MCRESVEARILWYLRHVLTIGKEILRKMATVDERLQAVLTAVASIQTGVDNIQKQLADLKAGNPDLDKEISAIEASVKALGDDVASSVV